jgi:hypothetical protein
MEKVFPENWRKTAAGFQPQPITPGDFLASGGWSFR